MQLNPRESFTVVRQIEDHTDGATYYVRAVIRNAKTDALLETLDLDDKGSRRFTKVWLVPADVSGQGFWISILTSVYTDSGYTTKSENYGDKMETYLVQERASGLSFGGGGSDIDYKRIQKMIDKALEDHKPEKVTVTKLVPQIKEVVREVVVKVPTVERVEIEKKVIVEKLMPHKEMNLNPIVDALREVSNDVKKIGASADKAMRSIAKDIEELEVNVPEMSVSLKPISAKGKKEPSEVPSRVKSLIKS